jgi:uncharacterized membrane protein/S-adenosylmethionine/arginine decarboxylase-like enzyme
MHLRSLRERIIQTLFYEAGGLLLVTPAYGWITGHTSAESLKTLVAVSIATMTWAALHNTFFDYFEACFTQRVASERPHVWRAVHACSSEASSIIVTTPVIMIVGGYGLWDALLIDIGLTLAYAAYGYLYHVGFDFLRPMHEAPAVLAFADQPALPQARASRSQPDVPHSAHIMIDGYGAPAHVLSDETYLRQLLQRLPRRLGYSAVPIAQVFQSAPHTVGLAGLAASPDCFLSIRAFPAHGFVTLDIYARDEPVDRNHIAFVMREVLQVRRVDVFVQQRGLRFAVRQTETVAPTERVMQMRAA